MYHAVGASRQDLAIKVYKTSILVFKDRDRYVSGEYRFRQGYSKTNPRKMVKMWAEKEMRNLKRLVSAGIPAPEPLLLRSHILVMQFFGDDGKAAPRLKDATMNDAQVADAYTQVVKHMWTLYNVCKLVHADLSEYNMLYWDEKVIVIDVSQSIETSTWVNDWSLQWRPLIVSFLLGRQPSQHGVATNGLLECNILLWKAWSTCDVRSSTVRLCDQRGVGS